MGAGSEGTRGCTPSQWQEAGGPVGRGPVGRSLLPSPLRRYFPPRSPGSSPGSEGAAAGEGGGGAWRAGVLGAWGLGAWPGAQLLCISRWRGEKCQLILDCKHIPVPTPPPPMASSQAAPTPIPGPAPGPLLPIAGSSKDMQSPWDSHLGSEKDCSQLWTREAPMLPAVRLWANGLPPLCLFPYL